MEHSILATRLLRLGFWLAIGYTCYKAFSPPPADPIFRVSDIVLHGVTFMVLVYALRMAYLPRFKAASKDWLVAAAWMLAFGAGIELVQALTPERQPQLKDLAVDAIGISLGLLAYRWLGNWSHGVVRQLIG